MAAGDKDHAMCLGCTWGWVDRRPGMTPSGMRQVTLHTTAIEAWHLGWMCPECATLEEAGLGNLDWTDLKDDGEVVVEKESGRRQ